MFRICGLTIAKTRRFLGITSVLVISLWGQSVYAEEQKPEWPPDLYGAVTYETKYVWRGQDMVDDPVVQPEASISKYGLTLSYWGNISTASSQKRWTEHDYTIDYTISVEKIRGWMAEYMKKEDSSVMGLLNNLALSVGNIFYVFPEYGGKDFHSEEVYLGASYDCFLQPWFKWYMDYGRGGGSYLQLGSSCSIDLTNGSDLTLGGILAYNAGQWGYGYKFSPLMLTGELNIPLLKHFMLSPNINYSIALDREEKNGLAYASEFYGGVKLIASY